jgi:hypothetical protein
MINKILSLVSSIFVVLFYFQSLLQPNDPIFLLKSNSLAINLALVALALGSIYLAFITKFLRWQMYLTIGLAAAALSIFSLIGIVDTHLSFKWPLELLDYFLIFQFGITYGMVVRIASIRCSRTEASTKKLNKTKKGPLGSLFCSVTRPEVCY